MQSIAHLKACDRSDRQTVKQSIQRNDIMCTHLVGHVYSNLRAVEDFTLVLHCPNTF